MRLTAGLQPAVIFSIGPHRWDLCFQDVAKESWAKKKLGSLLDMKNRVRFTFWARFIFFTLFTHYTRSPKSHTVLLILSQEGHTKVLELNMGWLPRKPRGVTSFFLSLSLSLSLPPPLPPPHAPFAFPSPPPPLSPPPTYLSSPSHSLIRRRGPWYQIQLPAGDARASYCPGLA
jgi:hypothetical protein